MFTWFTKNSQPIFGANFLLDKLIQVYYKVILSIHLIFFYQAESNDLIARRDD